MLLRLKLIHREDLRANRHLLFAFGDNYQRFGLMGQAQAMRGEPNSVGIATKWSPKEHFSEPRSEHQNHILTRDFQTLQRLLLNFEGLVYPLDGIGTGYAQMKTLAPSSWKHLKVLELQLFESLK